VLLKYWHTLRHLRPVQIYGRVWFWLYRPRPDERVAPPERAPAGGWVAPVARPVSMLGPQTFRFLDETRPAQGPGAWNDPAGEKLWLYNLHYFDDLNGVDAPARVDWHRELLIRWVAENPPGTGNGWEPYPTSLRIVNWIKWALAGNTLPPECVQSLAVQARWLRRRLEHHLLGNHLFANAKALVFAGSFFPGEEAKGWRERGRRLLSRELSEQILADGGHLERSPMYHAILLEDVLDLVNLAGAYPETVELGPLSFYWDSARGMAGWLEAMCHPDGEIGFFNDAAMSIAPTLAQLTDYAGRLGLRSEVRRQDLTGAGGVGLYTFGTYGNLTWLRDSGYVRLSMGPTVALLDVAPVGPDYLPGHAHADTLSFELSLFGLRVIVNGGTSRYGAGPERLAERGTAAHSTVQIDGADSSEVWGGFRVARRARPLDVHAEQTEEGFFASASHDGYRRLPGRPTHRRTWELSPEGLVVTDMIDGEFGGAIARFHLHPDVQAEGDKVQGRLRLRDGQQVRWRVTGGEARLVPERWHPEFGLSVPACCLEIRISGNACKTEIEWAAAGARARDHLRA
jgi:uncharacterized heparinase superfamily protein